MGLVPQGFSCFGVNLSLLENVILHMICFELSHSDLGLSHLFIGIMSRRTFLGKYIDRGCRENFD